MAAGQKVVKDVTAKVVTPSGIEISYEASPRRHYKVRQQIKYDGGTEPTEWVEATSVTTVLDCIAKPGLTWWGMDVGIKAVLELWERGKINFTVTDFESIKLAAQKGWESDNLWELATFENVRALVKQEKLDVDKVRDSAGDRGTSVHTALEAWIDHGTIPVPRFYPEEEQGYVEGVLAFINDVGIDPSKALSEVMVASYKHKFAGRYDLEAVLKNANLVTKLATPSWPGPRGKPEERTVFNGRSRLDLKTSKDVYDTHQIQLEGYEIGAVESGYPKSKHRLVVVVTPDGRYFVKESTATAKTFLNTLALYRSLKEMS